MPAQDFQLGPKIPPYFFFLLVIPGRLVDLFAESVASKLLGFVPASHGTHPKTAMLQRDRSSIFASADCNKRACRSSYLAATYRDRACQRSKRFVAVRVCQHERAVDIFLITRTERSVPDSGLTSCRTSFALHV